MVRNNHDLHSGKTYTDTADLLLILLVKFSRNQVLELHSFFLLQNLDSPRKVKRFHLYKDNTILYILII